MKDLRVWFDAGVKFSSHISHAFSITAPTAPNSMASSIFSTSFEQLASVFEQIAIYQAPIYVVGDLNIRLDRQGQFNHTDHSQGVYYGLGHIIRPVNYQWG